MYFDGSFTLSDVKGSVVLISPKGDWLLCVIRLHFHATNNVAEYEVLVKGLVVIVRVLGGGGGHMAQLRWVWATAHAGAARPLRKDTTREVATWTRQGGVLCSHVGEPQCDTLRAT
jgi:hypothetical protein